MPFKSQAQRRYLFAKHPEVAEEFASHTPKGASLPDHVKGPGMGGSHPRASKRKKKRSDDS
jgi:hypothetical protein